ncbi:uncharacterized protein BJX67DRAFT_378454 [Aspergillus lucknowensis]|uniref:Uncharacterized protein n=1 Tax=Aspergillus lucknowensis TaxID=176173 RepID=A0ABR4M2W9_9EURO
MDGFSASLEPPPEYVRVKWIVDLLVAGMGVGWLVHYIAMAYISLKDQTYCLNTMALCADFAWELTQVFVYPPSDQGELIAIVLALLINIFIMYGAVQAVPNEWRHSTLVQQNAPLIFVATTALWFGGMISLAAQLGPAHAYSIGAIICQMLISVGQICQLLSRNNSRGASYTIWLSRFIGSTFTVGFAALRYVYWPEAFSWLGEPLILWVVTVFFVSEFAYGYCLFRIKQEEAPSRGFDHKKE